MTSGELSVFVSTLVALTALTVGAIVLFGVTRLARRPGVLSEGPGDIEGAARIARVDRWTVGAVVVWATAALLVTFVFGGRAAIFGLIYVIALAAAGYSLLMFTETGRRLVDAMPQTWLISAQTYRIVGGVFLFAGAYDALPAYFATPAGWGDLITGIAAPLVALAWAAGAGFARRSAWAWNIFGFLDLVVAVGVGLSLFAAPAALVFGGSPAWLERAALGFQPFGPPIFPVGSPLTLVPTFLVPFAFLLHVLSMRKLVTERARAGDAVESGVPSTSPAGLSSHMA